jgi:hypothetical protein
MGRDLIRQESPLQNQSQRDVLVDGPDVGLALGLAAACEDLEGRSQA